MRINNYNIPIYNNIHPNKCYSNPNNNFTGNHKFDIEEGYSYFGNKCDYYYLPLNTSIREKTSKLWNRLGEINETDVKYNPYFNRTNTIDELDNMHPWEKQDFIRIYRNETGFPNLEKISEKMEAELINGVHKFSDYAKVDTKFIGYDSVNSVGRKNALPGMDCDGTFIVIDSKDRKIPFLESETMRGTLPYMINQRIISTPIASAPEILTLDFLNEELDKADNLFKKANFTTDDLYRFKENLNDGTNEFVRTAEFNIRLSKQIPNDKPEEKDKLIKVAMFVETLRDGKILENNLPDEFIEKVKESPLYEFSNIIKQTGFKKGEKEKHKRRRETLSQLNPLDEQKNFEIIRDIICSSMGIKTERNKELFVNSSANGENEMGDIIKMYNIMRGIE